MCMNFKKLFENNSKDFYMSIRITLLMLLLPLLITNDWIDTTHNFQSIKLSPLNSLHDLKVRNQILFVSISSLTFYIATHIGLRMYINFEVIFVGHNNYSALYQIQLRHILGKIFPLYS
jgi:hypothetical protein